MITAMPYDPSTAERWDALVDGSPHGTVLHTRRFLDYHGDRFEDRSLLLIDERERLVGVFSAALDPSDASTVVSHPGCTYGGLVVAPTGHAPDTVHAMFVAIGDAYRASGLQSVRYKAVPPHLAAVPHHADLHALWRLGATLVRRDLWNAFPTAAPRKLTKGHKWSMGRARKAELAVRPMDQDADYDDFHALLSANLQARHDTTPVHSVAELRDLRARLGSDAQLHGVRGPDGELLATSWVFHYGSQAWHTQYIASNPAGRDVGATVFLLEGLIQQATEAGIAWFSFGASTEDGGRTLNPGLFKHKSSFGHGSVVHDHFDWPLTGVP